MEKTIIWTFAVDCQDITVQQIHLMPTFLFSSTISLTNNCPLVLTRLAVAIPNQVKFLTLQGMIHQYP